MVESTASSELLEPLTLRGLLEEPPLRRSSIWCHGDQLDRLVRWCVPWSEALEDPASLEGVAVYARSEQVATAQRFQLAQLAERSIAALLVSDHAMTSATPDMSGLDCPVVRLPAGVGFQVLSRLVAERTLAQSAHVMSYGVMVHRMLARMLHQGAELSAMAHQVSRLAGSPVLILDPGWKLLVRSATSGPHPDLPDFTLVADRLRAVQSLVGKDDEPGQHHDVAVLAVDVEGRRLTCVVGAIVLGRHHDGWIVIVERDPTPVRHDLAQHRVIIEQAVTIIGTEMLRQRSVEEAEERARGDFVQALLHARFATPHDLGARASHYDFDPDGCYAVVAAHGFGLHGSGDSMSKLLSWGRQARRILPRRHIQTLVTTVGDMLVVVRQIEQATPGRADSRESINQVREYAVALRSELEKWVGRQITVTYGRPGSGPRGISTSYREARIALGICKRLRLDEIAGYGDLRLFAALADIADTEQGRSFADEVLAPLRRSARSELEATVLAYVESGGNVNAAARRLHIHRNTMLYKVERASRLLELDLRNAEHRFTFWLAHRVDMLAQLSSMVDREAPPNS
jgi:sugar diacid utilization regulator